MNAKRGVLIAVIFILLLSSIVTAYQTRVFEGNVYSGTSLDVDDYTIILTMNYREDRIFVDAGDDWASIDLYECDDLKNLYVCFTNVTFDEDELRTYMVIEINKTDPSITVTRTITNTEFYAGEEQNVTIEVTNEGDPATDATYYEDWGNEFEITEIIEGPCSIEQSAIIWKGYIDEDKPLECEFTLLAKEKVSKGVVGSLEFFNGLKMETEYSTELVIEVESIIELQTRIILEDEKPDHTEFEWDTEEADESMPSIGEEIRLALNFTNKLRDDTWVDADVKISYPKSLQYLGSGYFLLQEEVSGGDNFTNYDYHRISSTGVMTKQMGNVLEWGGRFKNNGSREDSETFVLKFLAKKGGAHNVLIEATYEDEDGRKYTHFEYMVVNVGNKGIQTVLYLNDLDKRFEREEILYHEDDGAIESLNEYRLRLQLENRNAYSNLIDLKVEVSSENLTDFPTKTFDLMESGGRIIPYSFQFIAPRTESDQDYDLEIKTTYTTEFGEKFTNNTEFTIKVHKYDNIEINHEFESTTIDGDEDTLVTVSLKNNRLVDIKNVLVTEYLDSRFFIEGVHSRTLSLKADEEVDVYSYTLTAPRLTETEKLDVNTTVTYYDPDYQRQFNVTESNELTVEPKELDITVTRTIDNDVQVGQIVNVEFTITNSEEDEVMKDITINLLPQYEFDIVGTSQYVIEKLGPGESIELPDKLKIRIKFNESTTIDESVVVYYDIYSTRMEENSSTDSIDIDTGTSYSGPFIFVNRTLPNEVFANHSTKIVFRVVNKGDEAAEVTITEQGQNYTLKIPAHSERLADYTFYTSDLGKHDFPKATITYEYQGQTFTTVSDESSTVVKVRPILFVEPDELELEKGQVETDEVIHLDDQQESEEKGINARFILQLLLIFIVVAVIVAYLVYRTKGEPAPPILKE